MSSVDVDEVGERRGPARARSGWVTDRRPVVIALVAVLAVIVGGWGLQVWGPLNPNVSEFGRGSAAATAEHGRVDSTFLVNSSYSSVEIERIELVPRTGGGPVASPSIGRVFGAVWTGGVESAAPATALVEMPMVVPGRARFTVEWEYDTACQSSSSPSMNALITLRTAWGREMTITVAGVSVSCVPGSG